MTEICPKCGLPKDLCICDILEKEAQQQKIKIFTETRKFGKIVTIVEGINKDSLEKVVRAKAKNRLWWNFKERKNRASRRAQNKSKTNSCQPWLRPKQH